MSSVHVFPDITFIDGNLKVDIKLSPFNEKHRRAQQWLGDRVLEDCRAIMPIRTGSLQQRSQVTYDGRQVEFPGPYARFQYEGVVMVGEESRSPWARRGEKKVTTERALTYSSPAAVPHWFDEAKSRHNDYWISGVKDIIGGK